MVSSQNYVFRKKQNRCAKVIAAVFFVLMHACRLTYVLVYTDTLLCTLYNMCIYIYISRCRMCIYIYICILVYGYIMYVYCTHRYTCK